MPEERPVDGTPVIDTDRGGKITWHGPGQLVGYPIIGLAEPLDVVNFVRRLEESLIAVCAELGLADRPGRGPVRRVGARQTTAGPARKVGAIGIRVARATTLHGFALNCDCDLDRVQLDRAVRHLRCRRDVADRRTGPHGRRRRRHRPVCRRPCATPSTAAVRSVASTSVTVVPEGRKLLRLEVRNAETPIERKPPWIKTRLKTGPEYTELKALVTREGLHTVCEEAGCPNIYECWEDREATFLIGGEQCTRRCDFCQIDTGKPAELDRDEPRRVAESVQAMGLRYSTVTGVARDDLPDGGAWLYAETVRQIKALNPNTGVELLIPDFNGDPRAARDGLRVAPGSVGAQRRNGAADLQADPARVPLRAQPRRCITAARDYGLVTKSNLILGMGETPDEVRTALTDLHDAGCDIITITQYLRPSARHHPVERWVKPEEFVEHAAFAEELGFAGVLAGPLVRSSYRAGRLYAQAARVRAANSPPVS